MSELTWAIARGTGVSALVLFTVAVALGLVMAGRRGLPGVPKFVVTLVHRNVTLLATAFIGIHLVTLLLDSYAKVSITDLFVPFVSSAAHPLYVGLGTVAVDLLLAIMITSLLRHRVGPRVFRAVHWLTYLMWPVAVLHGLGTGTDASQTWFTALTLGCVALVVAAAISRLVPTLAARTHTLPTHTLPTHTHVEVAR